MPPVGTPTHLSVKDGSWTDPAVWDAGTVPGDGARVRIDHQVTYNSTSTAKLDSVSVNGTLRLTGTKSVMWVDTLTGMGCLDGGTAQSPAKAEFIFLRKEAPGTSTRLGMTWMGRVRLHGEPKTARLHSTADIPAGATSCDLEGLGTANWQVGDKILFIATEVLPNASTDPQYRGPPQVWTTYQGQAGTASDYKVLKADNGFRQSADEVRTITAIAGEDADLGRAADACPQGLWRDAAARPGDHARSAGLQSDPVDRVPQRGKQRGRRSRRPPAARPGHDLP
jgi:hypothetical protein